MHVWEIRVQMEGNWGNKKTEVDGAHGYLHLTPGLNELPPFETEKLIQRKTKQNPL